MAVKAAQKHDFYVSESVVYAPLLEEFCSRMNFPEDFVNRNCFDHPEVNIQPALIDQILHILHLIINNDRWHGRIPSEIPLMA